MNDFETIIIGGGPSGLSAALMLARYRVKTLIIDSALPRNRYSKSMYGMITLDGTSPKDFREDAIKEVTAYGVELLSQSLVIDIQRHGDRLQVILENGGFFSTNFVILAMGVVDILPDLPGVERYWGRGVHHCQYCAGYEYRDKRWAVLIRNESDYENVFSWRKMAKTLVAVPYAYELSEIQIANLSSIQALYSASKVTSIDGDHSQVHFLVFQDGQKKEIDVLWITPDQSHTKLVSQLGISLTSYGRIVRTDEGETSEAGIFACGDICLPPPQLVVSASADGALTATKVIGRLSR